MKKHYISTQIGLSSIELNGDIDQLKDFAMEMRQLADDNGIEYPKHFSDALFSIETSYQSHYQLDADYWGKVNPKLINIARNWSSETDEYIFYQVDIEENDNRTHHITTEPETFTEGLTEIIVKNTEEAMRLKEKFNKVVWVVTKSVESLRDIDLDNTEWPEHGKIRAFIDLSMVF